MLEIPRLACLNLHASLLPRYRGAAPIQAAIAAGDSETGITVMYMDEGLDTGDILLQEQLPILPNETGGSLHDRLAKLAPEALLAALDLLASRQRAAHAAGSGTRHLRAETGARTWPRSIGHRTPKRSNEKFAPSIPGPALLPSSPTRTAKARQLKIFRATVDRGQRLGAPGTLSRPNDDVICRDRPRRASGSTKCSSKESAG